MSPPQPTDDAAEQHDAVYALGRRPGKFYVSRSFEEKSESGPADAVRISGFRRGRSRRYAKRTRLGGGASGNAHGSTAAEFCFSKMTEASHEFLSAVHEGRQADQPTARFD